MRSEAHADHAQRALSPCAKAGVEASLPGTTASDQETG